MIQKDVVSSEDAMLCFVELMLVATEEFHFGQQIYS